MSCTYVADTLPNSDLFDLCCSEEESPVLISSGEEEEDESEIGGMEVGFDLEVSYNTEDNPCPWISLLLL